jgi:hypothetical protein
MRKLAFACLAIVGATSLALVAGRLAPGSGNASSHREAPLISEDPTADNTDLYAFRSPDNPNTFTIISNWIPGEDPAAGPNYYTFSQTARYNIKIDRTGDGRADQTWSFRFRTPPGQLFLGATQQSWSAWRNGKAFASGKTPPANVGPRTNKGDYEKAAEDMVAQRNGVSIFAGQRDDPFFADVGAIFDLVAIRKAGTTGNEGGGKDFLSGYNVHTIALQIPISQLDTPSHTIGIWSSTDRQNVTVGGKLRRGWTQVSRLGNPLINEVVIPTAQKDYWNSQPPAKDAQFRKYYESPLLATVLQKLYPQFGPFKDKGRDDLAMVLGTGLKTPALNYTGSTFADDLRLNLSIPPTPSGKINRLGVLGGDLAGYPNGRRLEDDVVDISERAVGGALIGHSLPLGDGVDANDVPNLRAFPYEAAPFSGYDNTKGVPFPKHP